MLSKGVAPCAAEPYDPAENLMDRRAIPTENESLFTKGSYHHSGKEVPLFSGVFIVYTPEKLETLPSPVGLFDGPKIEVVEGTTGDVGRNLWLQTRERVGILNFASAKKPGGGYKTGARAQEEDLCRCSTLYKGLVGQDEYYVPNRRCGTALYTDHIIYTPHVSFFRDDKTYALLPLDQVAPLDVITAPAPNAGAARESPREVNETLRRRARYVLDVAARNKVQHLVLGAWGCGVFRNDPEIVADAFGAWLEDERFRGVFGRVVFAIYANGLQGEVNLEVFRLRFPGS